MVQVKNINVAMAKAKIPKKNGCNNCILCAVLSIVIGWMVFVIYAWKNGYVDVAGWRKQHEPTVKLVAPIAKVSNSESEPIKIPIQITIDKKENAKPIISKSIAAVTNSAAALSTTGSTHVIFSTDCEPFQDWQSIVVFHSARTVGQVGPITRIASGCSDEKKVELTALYKKLYPEYHVHFTPDFKKDEKTGQKYHFYNKPYGLQHWLQYADPPIPDHTIIVLIDPDMIFIRPITTQISGLDNILYNKRDVKMLPDKIERGRPVGQLYGLGAPWARDFHKKFNRSHICGEGSPCLEERENIAENHYAVGPPYIVEKKDMWRIAQTWTEFVPRVFEGYPYLLAEMYAYSMAAAHEKLPHLQLEQYMVSNTDVEPGEGWRFVDQMDDVCVPPDEHGIFYPGKLVPTIMHYCQFYRAADLGFQKRRVPKDIFSCASPMLQDIPDKLGYTNYMIRNNKVGHLFIMNV